MSKYLRQYEKEFRKRFDLLFKRGFRIVLRVDSGGAMWQLGLENSTLRINAVFGFRGDIMGIGKKTAAFEFSDGFTDKPEWQNMNMLVHRFRQQKGLENIPPEAGLYGALPKLLEPVIDDILVHVQSLPQ